MRRRPGRQAGGWSSPGPGRRSTRRVIRVPLWSRTRSSAEVQPSSRTPGRAATRRRTSVSTTGRRTVSPPSSDRAPAATASAVMPGSRSSMAVTPCRSTRFQCRSWVTPSRGTGSWGSRSRSRTRTSSAYAPSAAAASRPAGPAPTTTTRTQLVMVGHLRPAAPRSRRRRRARRRAARIGTWAWSLVRSATSAFPWSGLGQYTDSTPSCRTVTAVAPLTLNRTRKSKPSCSLTGILVMVQVNWGDPSMSTRGHLATLGSSRVAACRRSP